MSERVTTFFGIRARNGEKEGASTDSASNRSGTTSHDRTPRASMTAGGGDSFNVITTDEADWGSESDVNESAEDIGNRKTATVAGTDEISGGT